MKGTRHREEQIIAILKQGEAGLSTAELCRQHGISEQTYYRWKAKYGGLESGDARKLKQLEDETFCCYHRHLSFTTPIPRQIFEAALERVRLSFDLCVYGYVVMPEHVHLLLSEPQQHTLADAIKSLKQGVSRRLIGEAEHFWQKRYYDFNVRNEPQFVEKLRYIHQNPVKRGLCARAEDWEWSSFVSSRRVVQGLSRLNANGQRGGEKERQGD
jgi:putative transposase